MEQIKKTGLDNIFRKLIPYDAFTVKANTSRTKLVRRLTHHISSKQRSGFKGQIDGSGFSLQEKSPWYISYPLPPFFVGRFEEKDNETIIKIRILNPLGVGITVSVYLLIGAFLLAGLLAFVGSGVNVFPLVAYLIAFGALGILLLSIWEFWSGMKNSKERLFDILGLKDVSKDMGEFLCPACGNPIHEDEEKCFKCEWTYKNHHE